MRRGGDGPLPHESRDGQLQNESATRGSATADGRRTAAGSGTVGGTVDLGWDEVSLTQPALIPCYLTERMNRENEQERETVVLLCVYKHSGPLGP